MTFRTVIRTKLHPLVLTSLAESEDGLPGTIHLCPRLCWAAGLAEMDQVEVMSLVDGTRLQATVMIGRLEEVRIPRGLVFGFECWMTLMVTATASVPEERLAEHVATLVRVDSRRNAPIEIARHPSRPVGSEPSFAPPPTRHTSSETAAPELSRTER